MPLEKNLVSSSAPTNVCQCRSTSARRKPPLARSSRSRPSSAWNVPVADASQGIGVDRLVLEVVADRVEERTQAGEAASERSDRQGSPGVPIGGEALQTVEDRSDGRRLEARPRGIDGAFGDRHDLEVELALRSRAPAVDGHVVDVPLGEQPAEVVEDERAVLGVLGQPICDDDQGQPARAEALEDDPRDLVGVTGGRRHEDAEIGRLDETVGQLPVRVVDRIDVRRVEHRHTVSSVRVADDPDAARIDGAERRTRARTARPDPPAGRGRPPRGWSGGARRRRSPPARRSR